MVIVRNPKRILKNLHSLSVSTVLNGPKCNFFGCLDFVDDIFPSSELLWDDSRCEKVKV